MAGKMGGATDPRGQLMFDMMDIYNHIKQLNPNVRFLFENVRMKKEFQDYVNTVIGVEPIEISSSKFVPQARQRLYWTNIPNVEQPTQVEYDVNSFIGELDLDPKSIKELCFMLSDKFENLFLILISKSEEKVFISCFISKNLIEEKELNASKIIRELSPLINGSGGGQPFFATGGGTNKNGIDQVILESKKIITQL